MVHDHANKGAHHQRGLDVHDCAFALPRAKVTAQRAINAAHKFFPEHMRQLMFFQRRMKQQPLEFRIAVMMLERIQREPLEDREVILSLDGFRDYQARIQTVVQTRLMIEDGAVKFFLGREVTKDHRFRHSGCPRNLFGGGAAKAALRKQTHGDAQNLQPALFAGHAPAVGAVTCLVLLG